MTTLHAYVTDAATSISTRYESRDGQLFVGPSVLTRAGVDSYYGEEVTGWEKLGLDPQREYRFLRSPEELKSALPRMKMRPMTSEHVPLTAQDHDEGKTIGTVGSDIVYDDDTDTVSASLSVWREPYIGRIKSRQQREISMGYAFRPVMTPGVWRGKPYDGVMADIEPNHFALVPEGRVNINSDGPLAAVADSATTGVRTVADTDDDKDKARVGDEGGETNPLEALVGCIRSFAPDMDDDQIRAAATQLIAALNAAPADAAAGDESCNGMTGDEGQTEQDRNNERRGEDDRLERDRIDRDHERVGMERRDARVGDSVRRAVRAEIMSELRAMDTAREEMRGVVGQAAMVGDSAGDLYRNALRTLGVPDTKLMSDGEAKRAFQREKGRRTEKRAVVGDSAGKANSADLRNALGLNRLIPGTGV